jgi:hypothetical protein
MMFLFAFFRALAHRYDKAPAPWVSVLVVSVVGAIFLALTLFLWYAVSSPSGLAKPPPAAGDTAHTAIGIMTERADALGYGPAFVMMDVQIAHPELQWQGQLEPSTAPDIVSVGTDGTAIAVAVRGAGGCAFARRDDAGTVTGTFAPPCTAQRALTAG